MKKKIGLIKIGQVDQFILDKLKKKLELNFNEFTISIDLLQDIIPLENSEYNIKRSQYKTSKILNRINNYAEIKQYFRILGIMDQDIYSKSLRFAFGRATSPRIDNLWHPVGALISITRLRESFYRRPEEEVLVEQRILKEAIHELGHTFNLEHCNKFCIMQFSNRLADTDEKPSKFCDSCLEKLRNFFKNLK